MTDLPSKELIELPAKKRINRRARRLFLAILGSLLLCTFMAWGYYLVTRQPLSKVFPPAKTFAKGIKPHYLFSIYGMQEPVGVAVTPDGDRIYAAESGAERMVRVYDREGKSLASFAPPQTRALGRSPVYLTLDSSGQVYVSDLIRRSVDIYDAGGNFKSSLKQPTVDGWLPLGLRFNGGALLLTEITEKKHRVLQLNKDGSLAFQFGREGKTGASDELWFPNSALADQRGRIYISDSNNARVQVLGPDFKWLYTIGDFSLPRGMALDEEERLYVVDTVGQNVKVFDASKDRAEPLFEFGDLGVRDGEFNYPNDIALDESDRLYIADRVNNRIQVWSY